MHSRHAREFKRDHQSSNVIVKYNDFKAFETNKKKKLATLHMKCVFIRLTNTYIRAP